MKMEKLNEMVGEWYGQLQDIFAELNQNSIDVHEANSEYIIAGYYDEANDEYVELQINLGGTPRTIVINSIEETYR